MTPPTLFISDLHLDAARPEIVRLFRRFLAGLGPANCRALYVLGDLFEAWIGDDEDDPTALQVLADLGGLAKRGVPLYLMRGNRDFLMGTGIETATGATLLPDPSVVNLDGRPALLMHGDTLCTGDRDYQAFRRMVRDPGWQQDFLARPLAERRAMAAALRETSRQETAGKPAGIMDVSPEAVAKALREHGVDLLIHGHTHRPAIHDFELDGRPRRRIVLGDWYEQGSVLRCQDGDCRLEQIQVARYK